jgi:hypothetical protein
MKSGVFYAVDPEDVISRTSWELQLVSEEKNRRLMCEVAASLGIGQLEQ